MPDTQPFSLAAVLTITTGRLLCPMHEVHALLNHMTGGNLYTRQFPRATDACRPWLLRWFPALHHVEIDALDTLMFAHGPKTGCHAYLTALLHDPRIGLTATYSVGQIPPTPDAVHDPLDERVEMTTNDRVIAVRTDKEPPYVSP